jgi:hypothetical protein
MKINHIINEFVTPQAVAQDPALEREPNVDVIIFGQMPRDFTANDVIEALEAVLPREYPPGTSHNTIGIPNSKAEQKMLEIAKHQGAVVTNKPLSIAQKLVKTFQTYGIKCRIDAPGLEEDIKVPGPMRMNDYHDQADAIQEKLRQAMQTGNKQLIQQLSKQRDDLDAHVKTHGMMPEAAQPPVAPDPQNYDSDVDYYTDRDAEDTTDPDADYENMDDAESDDWFDESREKIGNMDADAFDDALARMKKLAGAGPLKTVYDPARRVYKNVPHAVQPAQQPKKAPR